MTKQRISIKDVQIAIKGFIVGGAEEATFTITRDNEEAYEGATYKPVEIVEGKIHIAGTLVQAWLDNDTIKELMPNTELEPSFTLRGSIVSGKTPDRTIDIFGAKLDSLEISGMGLDGYAKINYAFKALDYKFS